MSSILLLLPGDRKKLPDILSLQQDRRISTLINSGLFYCQSYLFSFYEIVIDFLEKRNRPFLRFFLYLEASNDIIMLHNILSKDTKPLILPTEKDCFHLLLGRMSFYGLPLSIPKRMDRSDGCFVSASSQMRHCSLTSLSSNVCDLSPFRSR